MATALRKPGLPEVVLCGAVQPAGTTIWTADPGPALVKSPLVSLRKLKVKLLPVLLVTAPGGETVMEPSPLFAAASVNVAEAVRWEVSPVAVARNVAPLKSGE